LDMRVKLVFGEPEVVRNVTVVYLHKHLMSFVDMVFNPLCASSEGGKPAGGDCYPSFGAIQVALAMVLCSGRLSIFGADAWGFDTEAYLRPDNPTHYADSNAGGAFNYPMVKAACRGARPHCFGRELFQYLAMEEEGAVEIFVGGRINRTRGFKRRKWSR